MKLIIQIPCFNEEETIGVTVRALPRQVDGFSEVVILVIDDGSTDKTVDRAVEAGADRVVRLSRNRGLARAFATGLKSALDQGADVIVNTDGDNQYDARDIPALVRPVLEGRADIAIGCRPISTIAHFSFAKKMLQRVGSWAVRFVSKTDVRDAPSGFRAFSRFAAENLFLFNSFTHTLETIIQAGQRGLSVVSVPVRVNPMLRPSRLFSSILVYVMRSASTIIRIFVIYRPMAFFGSIGLFLLFLGLVIGGRFLVYLASGDGGGHIQSLILASILLGMGFQTVLVAFIADLLAANRMLLQSLHCHETKGTATTKPNTHG